MLLYSATHKAITAVLLGAISANAFSSPVIASTLVEPIKRAVLGADEET